MTVKLVEVLKSGEFGGHSSFAMKPVQLALIEKWVKINWVKNLEII